MPELEAVGIINDVDKRSFEPITIPIVGYTLEGTPVTRKFRFWPSLNFEAAVNMYREVKPDGSPKESAVFGYLDKCLLPDDLEDFWAFVGQRPVGDDPAVVVEQATFMAVYQALIKEYGARPTLPVSGSSNGSSTAKATSSGGARARASRSAAARSAAA